MSTLSSILQHHDYYEHSAAVPKAIRYPPLATALTSAVMRRPPFTTWFDSPFPTWLSSLFSIVFDAPFLTWFNLWFSIWFDLRFTIRFDSVFLIQFKSRLTFYFLFDSHLSSHITVGLHGVPNFPGYLWNSPTLKSCNIPQFWELKLVLARTI